MKKPAKKPSAPSKGKAEPASAKASKPRRHNRRERLRANQRILRRLLKGWSDAEASDAAPILPNLTKEPKRKRAFLLALIETGGRVNRAAEAAKIHRTLHYKWMETDAEYAKAFTVALSQAADVLEDEIIRRAYEGSLEAVYYQGSICGYKRNLSDYMLMRLIETRKPEYRQKSAVEHSGPEGGPMSVSILVERLEAGRQRAAAASDHDQ